MATRPVLLILALNAVVFALLSPLLLSPEQVWLAWLNLAVALVALLWRFLLGSRLAAQGVSPKPEHRKVSSQALLYSIELALLLAVLGTLNLLARASNWRWDFTKDQIFSLRAETKAFLKSLKEPLSIVVVGQSQELKKRGILDLVNLYQSEQSDFIKVQVLDPARSPFLVDQYAFRPGDLLAVVREQGGKRKIRYLNRVDEHELSNALFRLSQAAASVVYYVEGHGEPALHSNTEQGLSSLVELVAESNVALHGLVPIGLKDFPADTAAVVLASPQKELNSAEIALFKGYLERGGNVLLLHDPAYGPGHGPSADQLNTIPSLAADYGIKVGQDLLIDPEQRFHGADLWQIVTNDYGFHPMTATLAKNQISVFLQAASVRVARADSSTERRVELVKSPKSVWAETDLAQLFSEKPRATRDPGEAFGALSLAVAYSHKLADTRGFDSGKETRLVVFGDSEWLKNLGITVYANRDLAQAVFQWLLGNENALSFIPRVVNQSLEPLSAASVSTLKLSYFLLIEALCILGLLFSLSRRFTS